MRFFLRRFLSVVVAVLIFAAAFPASAHEMVWPDVSAEAAVLFCPDTGEYFFQKNSSRQMPIASTTKILTTLIALEYIEENGDKLITVTEEDVAVEGSSMGLKPGDKLLMSQLCVGMMLASGNDAANTAANNISDNFAAVMNERAEEIGMMSSGFVTPSGLDAEGHCSTAADMALLTAEALKNDEFARIASSKSLSLIYNNDATVVRFENHNKLLWSLEGCIGVKTGYTRSAGRCLVSAVERNSIKLICVTLNAPDDWNDHVKLYDTAFSSMNVHTPERNEFVVHATEYPITCILENNEEICYFSSADISERVYLPRFIYSGAYNEGDAIGRVEYILNNKVIAVKRIIKR